MGIFILELELIGCFDYKDDEDLFLNNLGIYWDLAGPVEWAEPGRGNLPVDKCRPRYFRGGRP